MTKFKEMIHMTTKTDFHSIEELKAKYTPAQRGIVTAEETKTICEILELDLRSDIELQNIRDVSVMLYGQWADSQQQRDNIITAMQMMDAISAITHVIDIEKSKRGLPV